MDAIHGCHRLLGKLVSEAPDPDDFFCFTLNRSGSIIYCFCLKAVELVPEGDQALCVTPVRYLVLSEEPGFECCYWALVHLRRARQAHMLRYWTTGTLGGRDSFFQADEIGLENLENTFLKKNLSSSQLLCWTAHALAGAGRGNILALVLALLSDQRVMLVSRSQAKRALAVLALIHTLGNAIEYPHPVLAASPCGIATELPSAPTPVLAGIPPAEAYRWRRRDSATSHFFPHTIFFDLDSNTLYAFCPNVRLDVESLFSKGRVGDGKASCSPLHAAQCSAMQKMGVVGKTDDLLLRGIAEMEGIRAEIEGFVKRVEEEESTTEDPSLRTVGLSQTFQLHMQQRDSPHI